MTDDKNKTLKKDQQTGAENAVPAEGEAYIKNAHATGDGSFGRSESSLPESEGKSGEATMDEETRNAY